MSKRTCIAVSSVLTFLVTSSGCGGGSGAEGQHGAASTAKTAGEPAAPKAAAGGGTFGTASVRGKVVFEGPAPTAKSVQMDADPYCSLQHPGGAADYDYVVGAGGGLKWAFVYVKEGLVGAYTAPATQVLLDQRGCAYSPHVFGIMAGQDLKILNSDETLHNIHSLPAASRQFNLAMPRVGMELTQKFTAKEVMVRIKCDVHPWMECWAGVLDHPFHAVSGDDGSFSIDRLPAGTYTIEAWHEEGGSLTQTVTVADGASQEITFSFKPAV
jgi:plastocyanin